MDINFAYLCRNLRFMRDLHDLSQEKLSDILHMTRSTYSAYETGARLPDLYTLLSFSSFYGVDLEMLLTHDLSSGTLSSIYFTDEFSELADLLREYESLSAVSKRIIAERLELLAEK